MAPIDKLDGFPARRHKRRGIPATTLNDQAAFAGGWAFAQASGVQSLICQFVIEGSAESTARR